MSLPLENCFEQKLNRAFLRVVEGIVEQTATFLKILSQFQKN